MTDFDLERLGNVWRKQPDARQLEELKRSAEAVRRRARWSQLIDSAAAALVAGVVTFLVIASPRLETILIGGGAILLLLYGQYRHRRLREEELRGLGGSAEAMLDQSIARLRATLKRTRFQLLGIAPSVVVGLVVANTVDRDAGGGLLSDVVARPVMGIVIVLAALIALGVMASWFVRSMRHDRRELKSLLVLRQAYRDEPDPTPGH